MKFPDHAPYNKRSFSKINRKIQELSPDYVITTEKDIVKLDVLKFEIPLLVLRVGMKIYDPDSLWKLILKKILSF